MITRNTLKVQETLSFVSSSMYFSIFFFLHDTSNIGKQDPVEMASWAVSNTGAREVYTVLICLCEY